MAILFTIVALVLVVAGGTGLVVTCSNYMVGTLDWIEGILTYGVFVVLGIATVIAITLTPIER